MEAALGSPLSEVATSQPSEAPQITSGRYRGWGRLGGGRRQENAEYKDLIASDSTAKEVTARPPPRSPPPPWHLRSSRHVSSRCSDSFPTDSAPDGGAAVCWFVHRVSAAPAALCQLWPSVCQRFHIPARCPTGIRVIRGPGFISAGAFAFACRFMAVFRARPGRSARTACRSVECRVWGDAQRVIHERT